MFNGFSPTLGRSTGTGCEVDGVSVVDEMEIVGTVAWSTGGVAAGFSESTVDDSFNFLAASRAAITKGVAMIHA